MGGLLTRGIARTSGFVLLEVLVSLGILAAGGTLAMLAFRQAVTRTVFRDQEFFAMEFARQKMEAALEHDRRVPGMETGRGEGAFSSFLWEKEATPLGSILRQNASGEPVEYLWLVGLEVRVRHEAWKPPRCVRLNTRVIRFTLEAGP